MGVTQVRAPWTRDPRPETRDPRRGVARFRRAVLLIFAAVLLCPVILPWDHSGFAASPEARFTLLASFTWSGNDPDDNFWDNPANWIGPSITSYPDDPNDDASITTLDPISLENFSSTVTIEDFFIGTPYDEGEPTITSNGNSKTLNCDSVVITGTSGRRIIAGVDGRAKITTE